MKRILLIWLLLFTGMVFAQTSEDKFFQEAEGRFKIKDYELALSLYDKLLQDYPISKYLADVQFRRAVCLYSLGRYDDALDLFKKVGKRYSATRFINILPFWTGITFYRLNDYENAVESFNAYLLKSEGLLQNEALLYKGLSEIELRRNENAVDSIRKIIESGEKIEDNPYPFTLLCSLYLKIKDYISVLDIIESVNLDKIDSQWMDRFMLYKAEALWNTGNREKAQELYKSLLQADPGVSSIAYQRLFTVYQELGDEEAMLSVLSFAESSLSGMPEILKEFWLRIGIESYKKGKYDLSRAYFQRIWNMSGYNTMSGLVPLYLSELLAVSGKTEEAEDTLRTYLDFSDDKRESILFKLAGFLFQREDFGQANTVFNQFLEEYPDSVLYNDAAYLNAYALYKAGLVRESLGLVEDIFKTGRAGDYTSKLLKLEAVLYQKEGDNKSAVDILKKYISLNPEDAAARIDLIKLYFKEKNYKQVISESSVFLSDKDLKGKNPDSYILLKYLRGLSCISYKEYTKALSDLETVTANPVDISWMPVILPYALFYKAWVNYRLAEYNAALEEYSYFIDNFHDNELVPRALYFAGWCAYTLGYYDDAQDYFSSYSKAVPEELKSKGMFMYAKSLTGESRNNEAALMFKSIYEDMPESEFADDAMFEHAGILALQDYTDEAIEKYSEIYKKYPDSVLSEEGMYNNGELFYKNKDYKKAGEAFYKYRTLFPEGKLTDASLYWGGMASYEYGEKFGAVLLWEKLVNEFKNSSFRPDAIKKTAEIYTETGDYKEALTLYMDLINEYPDEAEASSVSIKVDKLKYLMIGQSEKEAELSAVIEKEGGKKTAEGRNAMIELAKIYIYKGGLDQELAVKMLKNVISVKKEDISTAARAQYYIGEYYYRRNELAKAGKEFLTAAIMNPEDKDLMAISMYRAAEMAVLSGNRREAEAMVRKIEEYFPDSQWVVEGEKLLESKK